MVGEPCVGGLCRFPLDWAAVKGWRRKNNEGFHIPEFRVVREKVGYSPTWIHGLSHVCSPSFMMWFVVHIGGPGMSFHLWCYLVKVVMCMHM